MKIYGNPDPKSTLDGKRTPTFALRMNCFETAGELEEALVNRKIITGSGNFYARYFTEALGLDQSGGYVRIGFVHYNTINEVDQVIQTLKDIESEYCK